MRCSSSAGPGCGTGGGELPERVGRRADVDEDAAPNSEKETRGVSHKRRVTVSVHVICCAGMFAGRLLLEIALELGIDVVGALHARGHLGLPSGCVRLSRLRVGQDLGERSKLGAMRMRFWP